MPNPNPKATAIPKLPDVSDLLVWAVEDDLIRMSKIMDADLQDALVAYSKRILALACYEAGRAAASGQAGWVSVPMEPTSEMLDAATEEEVHVCEQGDPYYSDRPMSESDARKVWQAMLAASPSALVASPVETQDDTSLLDWLDTQAKAYGFADVHEGNVWEIGGAYRTIRDAIKAERAASPAVAGEAKVQP